MNITIANREFPYILIDDFYDESELECIWEELDYLCNPLRMQLYLDNIENGAAWDTENGDKKLLKRINSITGQCG